MVTLILISALSVVSLNMFVASLSNIADAFWTDYALVNLSIAGYAGTSAALQLIMCNNPSSRSRRVGFCTVSAS